MPDCARSQMATFAPSRANFRAVARPMPWAAPVMMQTLSWRRVDVMGMVRLSWNSRKHTMQPSRGRCARASRCQSRRLRVRITEFGELAVGRAQQPGAGEPRLLEHGLFLGEDAKPVLAVVGARAAVADAAERQVLLRDVQQRVVDGDAAGHGFAQHPLLAARGRGRTSTGPAAGRARSRSRSPRRASRSPSPAAAGRRSLPA